MTKVSVCIATYNHEAYIARAIEGALIQQTDFAYEIIVGEDDSTDSTRQIVVDYAAQYPDKIRAFLNDRKNVVYVNGRPTGRWNLVNTLKQARGKYIALCDGDDYWTDPTKLQKQIEFLEANPEYVLSHHNAVVVDSNDTVLQSSYLPDVMQRDFSADELVKRGCVLPLTACFRNVLSEYPPEFFKVLNGDTFLFSMLGAFGDGKYLGSEISPAVYRKHSGGIWSPLHLWSTSFHQTQTYYWLGRYHARKGCEGYARYFRNLYKRSLVNLIDTPGLSPSHTRICLEFLSRLENLTDARFRTLFAKRLVLEFLRR